VSAVSVGGLGLVELDVSLMALETKRWFQLVFLWEALFWLGIWMLIILLSRHEDLQRAINSAPSHEIR
jgi:hypothetical protein